MGGILKNNFISGSGVIGDASITESKLSGTYLSLLSTTTLAATATTVTISGLTGDTNKELILHLTIKSNVNPALFSMTINNDGAAQYGYIRTTNDGTNITAANGYLTYFWLGTSSAANEFIEVWIHLNALQGSSRMGFMDTINGTAAGGYIISRHEAIIYCTPTNTQITRMDFIANAADGFGIGTKIDIYGRSKA